MAGPHRLEVPSRWSVAVWTLAGLAYGVAAVELARSGGRPHAPVLNAALLVCGVIAGVVVLWSRRRLHHQAALFATAALASLSIGGVALWSRADDRDVMTVALSITCAVVAGYVFGQRHAPPSARSGASSPGAVADVAHGRQPSRDGSHQDPPVGTDRRRPLRN